MPYPDGNKLGAPTLFSERLMLSKFQPVGVELYNLYVDSDTGQDESPGNGGQATPYKTIPRAVKDVAAASLLETSIINLSGAAPHIIPDGYVFPAILNTDRPTVDPTPGAFFTRLAPLVLRAAPVIVATIAPADITGQAFNAAGLLTVTVSLVLVPNTLGGKCCRLENGQFVRVVGNDATTIKLCHTVAVLGPLVIFDEGAQIDPQTPGSFTPTLCFRGQAPVMLQGLSIADGGGFWPGVAIDAAQGQLIFVEACTVSVISLGGDASVGADAGPGYLSAAGIRTKGGSVLSGRAALLGSLLEDPDFTLTGKGAALSLQACYLVKPINLFSEGSVSFADSRASFCEFDQSSGRMIYQQGGELRLDTCLVRGAGQDAIVATLGALAMLNAVQVNSTIGEACVIDGGAYAEITGLTGTLNTAGLQVNNGAQAKIDATTNVNAGTSDLKVGSLPATTWAAFHVSKNEFDTTALTGQLSRAWEP